MQIELQLSDSLPDLGWEDRVLDRFWRERFDQPLPMRGATESMKLTLIADGLADRIIKGALRLERKRSLTRQ